jgi:glycosyltransferase involved in cell wall biosynthesis
MQLNRDAQPPRSHDAHVPKVTIGIPVYNGEAFIREALDSALSQSFPDFEILVSDNASTDGTEAICREYMHKDDRINYVRQSTNIGPADNFRYLIEHARGMYFKWLAHDDLMDASFLAMAVSYLDQHNDVVLCACDTAIVNGFTGQVVEIRHIDALRDTVKWELARQTLLSRSLQYPSSCLWAIYGVYKLDALKSVRSSMRRGLWGMSNSVEYPLLAQLALQGKIVALPYTGITNRFQETSTSRIEGKRFSNLQRFLNDLNQIPSVLKAVLCSKLRVKDKLHTLLNSVFVDVPRLTTSYTLASVAAITKTTINVVGGQGSARRVRYAVSKWLARSKA